MGRMLRAVGGLIGAVALAASADPLPAPALIQAMIGGLRIGNDLAAIAGEAAGQLAAQSGAVAPEDRKRLTALVRSGFDAGLLRSHVLEELRARFDSIYAQSAVDWLGSEATRDLIARGQAASEACLEGLPLAELADRATPERDALVRQVARGTGAAGRSLRRATLVFSAMLVTGNELLPEERRYTDEELQLMIGSQRAALARQHAVDLRALHCAYRDVDTSVLRGAADFLSGPAGHWMRSSVDAAFERALLGAAESTAQRIVDTFGTSPPAAPLRTALR